MADLNQTMRIKWLFLNKSFTDLIAGEYGNGDANTEAITHLVFPSATFALTEKTCWTKNGEIGTCLNVRACYPLFNLSSGSFDGRYATCNYMSFGKQVPIKFLPNLKLHLPTIRISFTEFAAHWNLTLPPKSQM